MIKIIIAEDHNALIDGVRLYLDREPDIQFLGYANDGRTLVELVNKHKPDVVVTDIRMPVMDGIEATRLILRRHPSTRVIAFTMFDQEDAIQQMLNAGASGYVLKNSSLTQLFLAVRTVYSGERFLDPQVKGVDERAKSGVLTRRQIEILGLIAKGKTNQEIADELFIGKTTVETHRKNMIRILNLKGPGELLRYAVERRYSV